MKLLSACAAAVTAMLANPVGAQVPSTWLCISDYSTGFSNEGGAWRSVTFKAGNRYLIKRSQRKDAAWEVQEFGKPTVMPLAVCKDDFNTYKFLFCRGFNEFRFNAATGRFLNVYMIGYWSYNSGQSFSRDGGDTPSMEIGTCSAL